MHRNQKSTTAFEIVGAKVFEQQQTLREVIVSTETHLTEKESLETAQAKIGNFHIDDYDYAGTILAAIARAKGE